MNKFFLFESIFVEKIAPSLAKPPEYLYLHTLPTRNGKKLVTFLDLATRFEGELVGLLIVFDRLEGFED